MWPTQPEIDHRLALREGAAARLGLNQSGRQRTVVSGSLEGDPGLVGDLERLVEKLECGLSVAVEQGGPPEERQPRTIVADGSQAADEIVGQLGLGAQLARPAQDERGEDRGGAGIELGSLVTDATGGLGGGDRLLQNRPLAL